MMERLARLLVPHPTHRPTDFWLQGRMRLLDLVQGSWYYRCTCGAFYPRTKLNLRVTYLKSLAGTAEELYMQ